MTTGVAVILARGGSRGVPGKNIAPVAGRPCIAWTIEAARRSRCIAGVWVSTDSAAIADVARRAEAGVIDRPADLASDTASVEDAARHALGEIERRAGTPLGGRCPIVILYGNVPVRPEGLVDRAVARLVETGADSVQSYAPVGKFHPWWTARVDPASGRVTPWEGEVLNHGVHRRQDLPAAYVPDGGVLVVTRAALRREIPGVPAGPHAFLGADRRGVLTGEGEVVDIDTPVDLAVADAVLRR